MVNSSAVKVSMAQQLALRSANGAYMHIKSQDRVLATSPFQRSHLGLQLVLRHWSLLAGAVVSCCSRPVLGVLLLCLYRRLLLLSFCWLGRRALHVWWWLLIDAAIIGGCLRIVQRRLRQAALRLIPTMCPGVSRRVRGSTRKGSSLCSRRR